MKTLRSFFLFALLIAIGAGGYLYFRDTQPPIIQLTPGQGSLSANSPLTLTLNDDGRGLAHVTVTVLQNGKQLQLLDADYPPQTKTVTLPLELSAVVLEDGILAIQIQCGDHAIYHFGKGNQSLATFNFLRDSRPPVFSVLSTAHNLNHGGAGLIVYRISEPVRRSGIQIEHRFFPGYLQPSGDYLCLFAFPYDVKTSSVPQLVAEDEAGNEGRGGFFYHLNARKFKVDNIQISDQFLNSKMPQFQHLFPEASQPVDLFLRVNRELRPQNRAWLSDAAAQTSDHFNWSQPFLRQPNAATRATFGDQRHYLYHGKEIDRQTHLGIDLASIARAEVPATNSGRVVFAEFMGIYGQCVIIDHGLGLQTLYAHLSSIDVSVGQDVERGQIIGRTGATGLAGGDHLHYGVILSGTPVNPVEWWDKNWILNNIFSKTSSTSN